MKYPWWIHPIVGLPNELGRSSISIIYNVAFSKATPVDIMSKTSILPARLVFFLNVISQMMTTSNPLGYSIKIKIDWISDMFSFPRAKAASVSLNVLSMRFISVWDCSILLFISMIKQLSLMPSTFCSPYLCALYLKGENEMELGLLGSLPLWL